MPHAALRSCRKTGCPKLVVKGYCDDHTKAPTKVYDRWRGSAISRGYGHDWQRLRLQALKRDCYLCQHCLKNNRVTPAIDVDHIVPIAIQPESRLDIDNLQSLCRSCHNVKHQRVAIFRTQI